MSRRGKWIFLVLSLFPFTAHACEPVMQLGMIWTGASIYAWMSLGATVVFKCVAFAFLERRLSWLDAFGYMLAANAYSSLIGIMMGIVTAIPLFIVFAAPLVFFASLIPAKRVQKLGNWPWTERFKPAHLAGAMAVLVLVSTVLFVLSANLVDAHKPVLYWPLKFGYVTAGMVMGILLTSLWEEQIIGRFKPGPGGFFPNVLRANYLIFGVVVLVLAIRILPKRLGSPEFLAWFEAVLA